MGVGKMGGGENDGEEGRGLQGGGFGVLAGLSHAIHNLAGGYVVCCFFVMDAKL